MFLTIHLESFIADSFLDSHLFLEKVGVCHIATTAISAKPIITRMLCAARYCNRYLASLLTQLVSTGRTDAKEL